MMPKGLRLYPDPIITPRIHPIKLIFRSNLRSIIVPQLGIQIHISLGKLVSFWPFSNAITSLIEFRIPAFWGRPFKCRLSRGVFAGVLIEMNKKGDQEVNQEREGKVLYVRRGT